MDFDCLANALFAIRTTPSRVTGRSPAESLMGRKLLSPLDMMLPHAVGDAVLARNFSALGPKWLGATVAGRQGKYVYVLRRGNDQLIRRYVDNVIKGHRTDLETDDLWLPSPQPPASPTPSSSSGDAPSQISSERPPVAPSRPQRQRRRPHYLSDYACHVNMEWSVQLPLSCSWLLPSPALAARFGDVLDIPFIKTSAEKVTADEVKIRGMELYAEPEDVTELLQFSWCPRSSRGWRVAHGWRLPRAKSVHNARPLPLAAHCGFLPSPWGTGIPSDSCAPTGHSQNSSYYSVWPFKYLTMPFSLRNAAQTFQRFVDETIASYMSTDVVDVLLASDSEEEHITLLQKFFQRFKAYGVCINPSKRMNGGSGSPDKVSAIRSFPTPTRAKQLRQFLGMISFYRLFLLNIAASVTLLEALVSPHCQQITLSKVSSRLSKPQGWLVKGHVTSAPKLFCSFSVNGGRFPRSHRRNLAARSKGQSKTVSFLLKATPPSPKKRELLDAQSAVRHFCSAIQGQRLIIYIDDKSLVHVFRNASQTLNDREILHLEFITCFTQSVMRTKMAKDVP
ncbi:hypothetical protein M514_27493 [Trichuris suis]|uniref:Reverse transcriptase domain-containing protein n=1 Tax=Trichuris suis TaxID=68888 RepID=A0A085MSX0_9BILA|nr:hypothetical protein M514_27493 [Trichuris suis]